jgi:hypothetical protein
MKNLSHFPKTDIRFWQSAVFRQPYTVDSHRRLTKEWYARVQFQGKRQFFPLGTPNRALRPPRHETYSYSSRSTAGHSRLRSMNETQTPRRQHILLKSRSAPFLRLSLASVPNARLLKATQPPSERSWLIFSDLRVIRRNSTIVKGNDLWVLASSAEGTVESMIS